MVYDCNQYKLHKLFVNKPNQLSLAKRKQWGKIEMHQPLDPIVFETNNYM